VAAPDLFPFNAIIDRPALYRFMAVDHYRYLVLKMPSPAVGLMSLLTIRNIYIR
jgi:hypothetical protein